jgi:hypothetical protein
MMFKPLTLFQSLENEEVLFDCMHKNSIPSYGNPSLETTLMKHIPLLLVSIVTPL